MVRAALIAMLPLLVVGCMMDDSHPLLVPENPFGAGPTVPPTQVQAAYAPAPQAVSVRVDSLGRKLVADNRQMGLQPQFITIGVPQSKVSQPEVFHRGTGALFITEGLVKQCTTDEQLAAVLCHELGRMVAERESLAAPRARQPMAEPPPEVRIGNTSGSYSGDVTMTQLAEQAKYHPPAYREAPAPVPDPDVLARNFLVKAGYQATELDAVAPLLKAAGGNTAWEKQLTSPVPARSWIHN